ncbi:MAG TPA: hypothetical protein VHD35_04455 [Chitinophagaceae bacterium]|nr:hypothetical protein [Chitinophagaceae bacterium]
MIASSIGKKFLAEYNRRQNTNYSAKEFFEKVFYPLFYNHAKHMMWVHNSPFFQLREKENISKRKEAFNKLQTRIKDEDIDGSVAVGYFSSDPVAPTSGQISNLKFPFEEEEIYASWIGAGFGIALEGKLSVYFPEENILWAIFEGWEKYRSYLNEYEDLQNTQIERWNGKWLIHRLSEFYAEKALFNPLSSKKDGGFEVRKIRWTELLLAIARIISIDVIMGYVYRLDKTNTTIGFIPFNLPQLKRPVQFYIDLFGENEFLNNAGRILRLYGTAFGFEKACEMGVIGVRALEPKDLRQYMSEQAKKSKLPDYSKANEEQQISFKTYQTWLLAMLDNKQLWDKANEAAQAYIQYEGEAKKVSLKNLRQVEEVLNSSFKRKFIEENIPIVETSTNAANAINKLVEEINSMPEDSFKYFLTLIKFRYSFLKSQNK